MDPGLDASPPTETLNLPERSRFGPYRIDSLLGSGGMGEVYRATDTRLNRTLAIKTLRFPSHASADQKRRFLREAQAVAALNHPNIVTLYDLATEGDVDYLVMEHVPGCPLGKSIPPGGFPLDRIIDYATQIAGALEAAHNAGIVHRDIKPANVILSNTGQMKLLDFGLAKLTSFSPQTNGETATREAELTRPGMVMGTLAYMSPEQARGENIDARSDLFSFGALVYEMATGQKAFPRCLDWQPPSPVPLHPALRPIVMKLVAPDRDLRYANAADVLADLRKLTPTHPKRSFLAWGIAASAVLLAGAAFYLARPSAPVLQGPETWVQLTSFPDSVSQPALSPDGRLLTFVRGEETFLAPGQIYLKTLPAGDPVPITADSMLKMSPGFSPDSQTLIYTAGQWDTWTVPLPGGKPRFWLKNASGLAWPSSGRLIYSELREHAFMTLASSAPDRSDRREIYIPATPHGMAHRTHPSPDGKNLLVIEMDRGNWLPCRLMPADGSGSGHSVGPPGSKCTEAAWSRDGRWMYFAMSVDSAFHIWRRRFPDGPLQQVTAGTGEEEGIAMFPDGKAFVTAVAQRHSTVWLHEGSKERQISLEGFSVDPQFTPDGKHLLYRILSAASTNYDPGSLRIVDLESGSNEPIFPGVAVFGPAGRGYHVSRDGSTLVAAGYDHDRQRRIWVGPVDRQTPPRRIDGVVGDSPFFGSRGEIYFRQFEGALAWPAVMRADGTGVRRFRNTQISMMVGLTPDASNLLVWTMDGALKKLPTDGAEPTVVFAHGDSCYAAWSADGRQFLLSVPKGATASTFVGSTYVVPLAQGQMLPPIPPGGFQRTSDLARLPGVTVIDAYDTASGLRPEIYAYSKSGVQRNLFRVPLP